MGGHAWGEDRVTRGQADRVAQLHAALVAGERVTAVGMAREMGVTERTVRRDLEYMRDRRRLPVTWDAEKRSYVYTEIVEGMPDAQISEEQMASLVMAERMLREVGGVGWAEGVARVHRDLSRRLGDLFARASRAGERVVVKGARQVGGQAEVLPEVARGVWGAEEIEFTYRKPGDELGERRRAEPHELVLHDSVWYVLGWDVERGGVRLFCLMRMESVASTGKRFRRRPEVTVAKVLKGAFGVWAGEGEHVVRLRVDGWAAPRVRERKWHPTQREVELRAADGEMIVVVELRVNDLREVERWVLGWGECVTVLAPAELRRQVASTALRLAERNRPGVELHEDEPLLPGFEAEGNHR